VSSANIFYPDWIGTRVPGTKTRVDSLSASIEGIELGGAPTAPNLPPPKTDITVMLGAGASPSILNILRDIAIPISEIEQIKQGAHLAWPSLTNPSQETITPSAEEYAKSKGFYGSLFVTKAIVREIIPSMKALLVDLREDFDDGGYATVCFTVTIQESVDRALALDNLLQDAVIDRIPANHRLHISFNYQFE